MTSCFSSIQNEDLISIIDYITNIQNKQDIFIYKNKNWISIKISIYNNFKNINNLNLNKNNQKILINKIILITDKTLRALDYLKDNF